MTGEMTANLTWTHPVAWGVYLYALLSLGLGFGLLWLRHQILHPQRDQLLLDAAEVLLQLRAARQQLVAINRQADRGLDQLEELFHLVRGLFLAVLETRLVSLVLDRLQHKPIWLRLAARKGLETAFAQAETVVRTHRIKDRDEAAYEHRKS